MGLQADLTRSFCLRQWPGAALLAPCAAPKRSSEPSRSASVGTAGGVPIVTCPGSITASAPLGLCGSNVVFSVTGSDNCGLRATNQLAGLPSGSLFPVGTTTNTFEVVDASGNHSASCTFVVTVIDTQAPAITCPGAVTSNADAGHCYATGVALGVPTGRQLRGAERQQ